MGRGLPHLGRPDRRSRPLPRRARVRLRGRWRRRWQRTVAAADVVPGGLGRGGGGGGGGDPNRATSRRGAEAGRIEARQSRCARIGGRLFFFNLACFFKFRSFLKIRKVRTLHPSKPGRFEKCRTKPAPDGLTAPLRSPLLPPLPPPQQQPVSRHRPSLPDYHAARTGSSPRMHLLRRYGPGRSHGLDPLRPL